MENKIEIIPLTEERLNEAVNVVLRANLDTSEEIEHHLKHIDAHYIAVDGKKVIGVIGWYQDNVNYANEAMGEKFPGAEAYWVGFFAVEEKYRGQGIGYGLLQKLEGVLKEQKVSKLWVSSVPESKDYYEKEGFKLVVTGKISGNQKFFLAKNLTS